MPCTSSTEPRQLGSRRWKNYIQKVDITVNSWWEPASLPELVTIVQKAEAAGKHIHVVGAGYSFEDIAATTDWMLDLKKLNHRVTGLVGNTGAKSALTDTWKNRQSGRDASPLRLAHTEAGVRLFDLCTQLSKEGLGPLSVGGALGQSLAGATQTSTHGSEPSIPPLCDQIQALHLVSGDGQEYWIERKSEPLTDNDQLLRLSIHACRDLRIIRDDSIFNAAIVSAGRFGIIYSIVFMVTKAIRVAEFGVSQPTRTALQKLPTEPAGEYGYFSGIETLLHNPPSAIMSGIRDIHSWRYLDIIINSRRPETCIVRRRWETSSVADFKLVDKQNFICEHSVANGIALAVQNALNLFSLAVSPIPFVGAVKATQAAAKAIEMTALAIQPNVSGGEVLAKSLNAMWEVQFESMLEEPINVVTDFAWNEETKDARETGRTGLMWQVAAGKLDPANIGNCYLGNSIEVMFKARSRGFKSFMDDVLKEAPKHRQAGYIAIRFSGRSDALLSMFHDFGERNEIFVSIEITSLKGLQGNQNWFTWLEQRALFHGGRLHWGQQNDMDAATVSRLYNKTLPAWKEACASIVGSRDTFSNHYTKQRGLEPAETAGFGWKKIGHLINAIAMGSSPTTLFAVTRNRKLWNREPVMENVFWKDIGRAAVCTGLAVVGDDIFMSQTNNRLMVRSIRTANDSWHDAGHVNNSSAMTAVGNQLFVTTKDNFLWTRHAERRELNWTRIGHANNVIALAGIDNNLYAITKDGILWKRTTEARDVPWQKVGDADNVFGIAVCNHQLFAATKDNMLWVRPLP